jgi:hypothetical protein
MKEKANRTKDENMQESMHKQYHVEIDGELGTGGFGTVTTI